MSATRTNRNVTRLVLSVVIALVLSLALSSVAAARQSYEGPLVRHQVAKHKKAKKKVRRKHRRARSAANPVVIDLCAKPGTTTLAGLVSPMPVWGFVEGGCGGAAGPVGPTLGAAATILEGDNVQVNLTNHLSEPVSFDIPGIQLAPGSTTVPAGGSGEIDFVATNPGTYLYESSANAGRQAEVGLAGAMIVRGNTAGQAYDDADGRSHYTSEHVMVLSEIDPALNAAADAGGLGNFDMMSWSPKYRLINGEPYVDGTTPAIEAAAGEDVLLRYVNVGSEQATMTMLGLDGTIVAESGSLMASSVGAVAMTFPAGATADSIVTVPSDASSGEQFPIYDRHLALVNGSAANAPGGRIRFIKVVP